MGMVKKTDGCFYTNVSQPLEVTDVYKQNTDKSK